jgi:hypothetical protein
MKYILIVTDNTPKTFFLEKDSINEIYALIVEMKLPEGSYKIIKGDIVK